jgi:serine protease Do
MQSDDLLELPELPSRPRRSGLLLIAGFLAGGLLVGFWPFFLRDKIWHRSDQISFAEVVEAVSPAVVSIAVQRRVDSQKSPEGGAFSSPSIPEEDLRRRSKAYGSGFIIDPRGIIATNRHVVDSAQSLVVRLLEGKEYPAELLGGDQETDIALIRIKTQAPLVTVKLGDSDRLRTGDWVMAMGNPFNFAHTVTVGVVSARQRLIEGQPFEQFIQTDAAINFGNSGGPLFNAQGEVVGMATAISTRGRSIGFAIPINVAKEIFQQLESRGRIIRGFIGVRSAQLTEELASLLGVKITEGIVVEDVAVDSGAAQAGIQRYDVITSLNGSPVSDRQDFYMQIARLRPGTQADVTVLRGGKSYRAQVPVQDRAQSLRKENPPSSPSSPEKGPVEKESEPWGVATQDLPDQLRTVTTAVGHPQGVWISSILPDSPAMEAELEPGDIILEINRQPVHSLQEYHQLILKTRLDPSLVLLISRSQGTRIFILKKR